MSDHIDHAQASLKTLLVQPGQKYRHYKGGEYEIVATAVEEATGNVVVVYRNIDNGYVWTRPFLEWFDVVTAPAGRPWGGCLATTRFVLIEEIPGHYQFSRPLE